MALTWSLWYFQLSIHYSVSCLWTDCSYASYTTVCYYGALDCVQLNKNFFFLILIDYKLLFYDFQDDVHILSNIYQIYNIRKRN